MHEDAEASPRRKLAALDLNLLVALEVILSEGSVTKAAERVNVSQSAMSHTLKRLRKLFSDPLLVRRGNTYSLTLRAEALRAPIRNILQQTEALFSTAEFDPANDQRTVTLAMTSSTARVVGGRLLSMIEAKAPNMRLKISVALDGPEGHFTREGVDVQLLSSIYPTQYERIRVYDDAWVVIAGTPDLTPDSVLDMLTTRPHVMFDSGAGSLAYEMLTSHGVNSDIRVRVKDPLLIPELVAGSRYVAIHRSAPLAALPQGTPIWSVPFPYDLGDLGVDIVWSPWHHDTAFQQWFNAVLQELFHTSG